MKNKKTPLLPMPVKSKNGAHPFAEKCDASTNTTASPLRPSSDDILLVTVLSDGVMVIFNGLSKYYIFLKNSN